MRVFSQACVDAGPETCAIHESTAEKVEDRLNAIFEAIKQRPLPAVPNGTDFSDQDYGVATYGLARNLLFQDYLYSPYGNYPWKEPIAPAIASIFYEIEQGNGFPLWNASKLGLTSFQCSSSSGSSNLPDRSAGVAVACGDGDPVYDTIEDLEALQVKLNNQSEFGDEWNLRANCVCVQSQPHFTPASDATDMD